MTPTTPSTVSVLDHVRAEWLLVKLSFLLDDLPGKRSRAIRADLRRELVAAAAHTGMRRAIAELGPLTVLAATYLEAEGRPLPRWRTGGVVALVIGGGWVWGTLAYALGLLDAASVSTVTLTMTPPADPHLVADTPTTGTFLWTQVEVLHTESALSASFSGIGPLLCLATMVVAYVVAARGWRLWSRA